MCGKEGSGTGNDGPGLIKFGEALKTKEEHWPKTTDAGAGEPDNAKAMTEGLVKLPRTDRNKVAGLLTKTISGAEVVENN